MFKYWELEAGAEPAEVMSTFANGKPAIVERQMGPGRVIIMTTSISDYLRRMPGIYCRPDRSRGRLLPS